MHLKVKKETLTPNCRKKYRIYILLLLSLIFLLHPNITAQSLSLYNAIQYSLKNNQTVLYSAKQNFISANAQLNSVNALYNPTLSAQASFSRNSNKTRVIESISGEEFNQFTQYQQFYPDITLQQTFLTPFGSKLSLTGGLQTTASGISSLSYQTSPSFELSYRQPLSSSGIESGHIEKELAEKSFQEAGINYELLKEQLVISVIQSYFELWQAEQNVEQSVSDKESAKRLLDIAEMKLKHGTIAEFEVLNLRVQYSITEDNLLQAQNDLKTQTISFLRIIGADHQKDKLDSALTLDKKIEIDSLDFSLEEAMQRAMKNRLELKQAEIAIAEARLSLNQISSSNTPSLQLNAYYTPSSNYEPTLLKSFYMPNYGLSILGTISIPILDGGRTSLLTEVSEGNISIQKENLALLKEDIAIDIETRFRTLALNLKRLRSLELSLETAKEAFKIAEMRFNSGQITSTEIENVRNRFNTSKNSLDGAKISYMINRSGLAKAMGELSTWIKNLEK